MPKKPESERKKRSNKEILETIISGKRLLSFIIKNFPVLALGTLTTILITSFLPVGESWLYGKLFDTLINTAVRDKHISSDLYWSLGLVILVSFLMGLFNRLNFYFDRYLRDMVEIKLSEEFTKKMASLDQEHFDNPDTNDLINKVTTKYQTSTYDFIITIFGIVDSLFGILFNLAALITLTPIIIIISLITSIPESVAGLFITKLRYRLWGEMAEVRRDSRRSRMYVSGEPEVREVRTFGIGGYLIKRFLDIDVTYINKVKNLRNRGIVISTMLGVFQQIGFGVIVIILTTYVIAEKISVGSLTFYITATNRIRNNIGNLLRNISAAYEMGLYVNEYFKFLDLKTLVPNGAVKFEKTKNPPLIEFKNVWFKYPQSKKYVLKKFNLKLRPGEHLAIVGENGAGKTTLIKLLMRFYDPTKGEIFINGTNLKELDIDSWYENIGTLFQEYNFYHFDAKTNIGVGDVKEIENLDKIIDSAKASGAHEFIQDYEHKYNQIMDKSFTGGINPSTGQKQRIALARAFFKDAPVLVLDEPTSSIDAKGEYEIFERLFGFAQNKSVIIISHRFSTVRNAKRIVVIENGEIVEEGPHEELTKIHNGKYKTAFEIQKKGYE